MFRDAGNIDGINLSYSPGKRFGILFCVHLLKIKHTIITVTVVSSTGILNLISVYR